MSMNNVLSVSKVHFYKYMISKIDGAKISDTYKFWDKWMNFKAHFFEFICVAKHQSSDKKEIS